MCQTGSTGSRCDRCGGWPGTSPDCAPTNLIIGTDGDDELGPSPVDDHLRGLGGNDVLRGSDGDDLLSGDEGDDFLNGNMGSDVVLGGDGNDRINGGTGDDLLSGGAGNDVLIGGGGADRLVGGPGDDVLVGESEEFTDGLEDWYWIDGLGNDEIVDTGDGRDLASCAAGVYIVARRFVGPDLRLELSTGGTVLVRDNRVEQFLGCDCP